MYELQQYGCAGIPVNKTTRGVIPSEKHSRKEAQTVQHACRVLLTRPLNYNYIRAT